jgi:calcium-dependent protein kinase
MILYILFIGRPPYDGTDEEIFNILKTVKIDVDGQLSHISEEARDLLKKLLEPDPNKRISARDACMHSWIKTYTQSISSKDITKVLLRIKSYRKTTKLKEAIHTFIISKIMDPKMFKTEEAVFNYLDVNRDGTITKNELIDLLSHEMPEEEAEMYSEMIMEHADSDKSGSIDYTEFLRATVKNKKVCTKENLLKAFNFFDEDKSGAIELIELSHALTDGATITEELVSDIMNQVDINGDGKIDLEEFETLLFDALSPTKKGIQQEVD